MPFDGTTAALIAERRLARQARQRTAADQRAAAVERIRAARTELRQARRDLADADAALAELIDGDEVLVRGDALYELHPHGGIRVRPCTQLGLFA